jgi:hypothetical protein
VEENWKRIEKVIKEAADKTVSKEENQCNKEWFYEECAKAVLEKNNARKRMLQRETRISCARYQELRRKANRICKKKKKERMKDRRKFHKAIDNLKKGFQPRSNGCRNKDGEIIREEGKILQRWEEYFKELLGTEKEYEDEEIKEKGMEKIKRKQEQEEGKQKQIKR